MRVHVVSGYAAVEELTMQRGRAWTRAEEVEAATLRWCGRTIPEIAAALGRSAGSVNSKLFDLGLAGAQRPKGELMRLVKVFAKKGWYDWEVGLELGVTAGAVARARKRAGVRANHKAQSARAKGRCAHAG